MNTPATKRVEIDLTTPMNRYDKFDTMYGFISGEEWCDNEYKRIHKSNPTVNVVDDGNYVSLRVTVSIRNKEIVSE